MAWYDAMDEANDVIDRKVQVDIQGYDLNPEAVKAARQNAKDAGVDPSDPFSGKSGKGFKPPEEVWLYHYKSDRMASDWRIKRICRSYTENLVRVFKKLDSWSAYMITSYEDAERYFGRKADKNRKIYNGMLKTYFYQFLGPKPPKRPKEPKQ